MTKGETAINKRVLLLSQCFQGSSAAEVFEKIKQNDNENVKNEDFK